MFYIKPNLQIYDFYDFYYYSCIVAAILNGDAIFYRFTIIENACKDIFKGNKYIAH